MIIPIKLFYIFKFGREQIFVFASGTLLQLFIREWTNNKLEKEYSDNEHELKNKLLKTSNSEEAMLS